MIVDAGTSEAHQLAILRTKTLKQLSHLQLAHLRGQLIVATEAHLLKHLRIELIEALDAHNIHHGLQVSLGMGEVFIHLLRNVEIQEYRNIEKNIKLSRRKPRKQQHPSGYPAQPCRSAPP